MQDRELRKAIEEAKAIEAEHPHTIAIEYDADRPDTHTAEARELRADSRDRFAIECRCGKRFEARTRGLVHSYYRRHRNTEDEHALAADQDRAERLERAKTIERPHVLARRWARWEVAGTTIVAVIDLPDGGVAELRIAERVFGDLATEIADSHNDKRGGDVARFVYDGMELRKAEPGTDGARFAESVARAYVNGDNDEAAAAAYLFGLEGIDR
jgi:hypothetical protein